MGLGFRATGISKICSLALTTSLTHMAGTTHVLQSFARPSTGSENRSSPPPARHCSQDLSTGPQAMLAETRNPSLLLTRLWFKEYFLKQKSPNGVNSLKPETKTLNPKA